jgi:hypothetical protein
VCHTVINGPISSSVAVLLSIVHTGNAVAIASSRMTGNDWDGQIAVWTDKDAVGNRGKADVGSTTKAGCPCVEVRNCFSLFDFN